MEEIGVVVGKTNSDEFVISLPRDTDLMENEYVVVNVKEKDRRREVVGRVKQIGALSHLLVEESSYEALEKIISTRIDRPKIFATVETLGYLDNGTVKFPRNPPLPGEKVYRAPKDLLERFYRVDRMPLHIGSLLTRDDIEIYLDPRGFLRHLAILAQTGAGKSYTAGVLIEELYRRGASMVIIDAHADYVRMMTDENGNVIIPRFTVFRNPLSTGRYSDVEAEDLTLSLGELDADDVAEIFGIGANASRQRGLLRVALDEIKAGKGGIVSFDDLYEKIKGWAEGEKLPSKYKDEDAVNVLRKLDIARRKGLSKLFTGASTPLDKIVKKMYVSIIDLSGLKNEIQDIITRAILSRIYDKNTTSEDIEPVFLVIEEAHNFVPNGKKTKSSEIIKKIAAEGRKFGVFLIIITQRPQKIDPDVLSQANSYIILKLTNSTDIKAVSKAAESLSADLSSLLPNLNPGEAVIVGPVIKTPAIVKIRERRTQEGGGDIDIITKLEEASKEAEGESEVVREATEEIGDLLRG